MNRALILLALLAAACATPEVAEKYETKSYVSEDLKAALGSEDPTVRADASRQIREMEPAARRGALLELTRDDRATVRLLAVSGLGRYHANEAEVELRLGEMLSLDPDPDVRIATVSALAAGDTEEALRALAAALMDDGSIAVKMAAASGLDKATGQNFGAAAKARLTDAEAAAEEAAMSYEDWLDQRGVGR